MPDTQMKAQRKQAARRRRRIIFNHDGGDFPYCREATVEEVLRINMTGLAGSQVDTVFLSTSAAGCDMYSHNTKVAHVYEDDAGIIKGLIDQGTDILQIMVEHSHANGMEIFSSFRVNDEHDAWIGGQTSQWKRSHPEYVMGMRDNPPPHGPWSALDYARPEVRDRFFNSIRDVCERYDVDGLELDFFRQLLCFKKHVWGGQLGQEEIDIMTGYLRRIRSMTDEVGRKRGRPLLIAARVPDCPDYARELALDIEGWLAEDLMDIMVVGGYFWLRPWEQSVELGRKYDVPVYPSLDGSRLGAVDPEAGNIRRSDEAYRAHAANAFRAGVDGIYVFNFNYMRDPSHRIWREIGDPQTLRGLDAIYHLNVMGTGFPNTDHYVRDGRKYVQIPTLCPQHPLKLLGGQRYVAALAVGDDATAADLKHVPKITLNIKVTDLPDSEQLSVKLNEQALDPGPLTWRFEKPDDWLEFVIEPQCVKKGANDLALTLTSQSNTETSCIVHDVFLRLEHGPSADRRRDLTMSRNRYLAYYDSLV